ncbi:MAG: potassium-transporting ATPase subunit F [Pirellulales bacterium]|jgi:K+-transporting ATPase KdpF subunit
MDFITIVALVMVAGLGAYLAAALLFPESLS